MGSSNYESAVRDPRNALIRAERDDELMAGSMRQDLTDPLPAHVVRSIKRENDAQGLDYIAFAWAVQAHICRLFEDAEDHAYAEGRADEREEWEPLADLLAEKFRIHQDEGGAVLLPVEAVMELSIALERAKRRN